MLPLDHTSAFTIPMIRGRRLVACQPGRQFTIHIPTNEHFPHLRGPFRCLNKLNFVVCTTEQGETLTMRDRVFILWSLERSRNG